MFSLTGCNAEGKHGPAFLVKVKEVAVKKSSRPSFQHFPTAAGSSSRYTAVSMNANPYKSAIKTTGTADLKICFITMK